MRRNLAFTLIELLVVVAILSVLIALLLPSLKDSLERARTVNCMNNAKQIYCAMTLYSQDFDRRIPENGSFTKYDAGMSNNDYRRKYHGLLASYIQNNVEISWTDRSLGYAGGPFKVFACPKAITLHQAVKPNWENTYTSSEYIRNWGYYNESIAACNYGLMGEFAGQRFSVIKNPQRKLLVTEARSHAISASYLYQKQYQGYTDLLFLHGLRYTQFTTHTEFDAVKGDDFYASVADEKATALFVDGQVGLKTRQYMWENRPTLGLIDD